MSQTEQKFDSLCTLAEKLKAKVDFNANFFFSNPKFSITIVIPDIGYKEFFDFDSKDQALTDALRYLRKIKTKQ